MKTVYYFMEVKMKRFTAPSSETETINWPLFKEVK